jgi:hypothetical protein
LIGAADADAERDRDVTIPRDTKRMIALQEELHSHLPSDPALRVKALESLLVEKGLLNSATVDRWIRSSATKSARRTARASSQSDCSERSYPLADLSRATTHGAANPKHDDRADDGDKNAVAD